MKRIIWFSIILSACIKKPVSTGNDAGEQSSNRVVEVQGFLDKRAIEEEIRRHVEPIYSCYRTRFYKSPSDNPRLVVEFVILTEDGSVVKATAKEDTIGSTKIKECILAEFMTMKFPAGMATDIISDRYIGPDGEVGVVITYPLLFDPR